MIDVNLDHLAEAMFVRFLHYKVTSLFPFFVLSALLGSHYVMLHFLVWSTEYINYFKLLFIGDSSIPPQFIYLSVYSIIYLCNWIYKYLGGAGDYNPKIL